MSSCLYVSPYVRLSILSSQPAGNEPHVSRERDIEINFLSSLCVCVNHQQAIQINNTMAMPTFDPTFCCCPLSTVAAVMNVRVRGVTERTIELEWEGSAVLTDFLLTYAPSSPGGGHRQSVCVSGYLPVCLSVCLRVCLSVCVSFCLSVHLSVCLVCLSACLSVRLSLNHSIRLSVNRCTSLSVCRNVYLPPTVHPSA